MALLERHPALKKALVNQYQAILVGGALASSVLLANPLPLLLLIGAECVTLPWMIERLKRRIELERKLAHRTARAVTQEEQYRELPAVLRERFVRLKHATERIQSNYRALTPEAQGLLGDQSDRLDAILVSCLRRLWLLKKHDELDEAIDEKQMAAECEELEARIEKAGDGVEPRVRGAWAQTLGIKKRVLETALRNQGTRETLQAELDSIESLLQLLLQKSLAASDAETFAAEVNDALSQAEADERTVHEMEQLVGAEPMATREPLSDALRSVQSPLPPPPPPLRARQR